MTRVTLHMGGKSVEMGDVSEAVRRMRGAWARKAAFGQPQVGLEECTGVADEQAAREAEAGGIAADRLRSIVERIEALEEERRKLASDMKDIYAGAQGAGLDRKVVRRVIRDRRREPAELENEEALLDLYRRALGM